MTEQRPEDNEQALTDSGVWVDESSSGLTHDPGVWVDPPAIDPDRLGAMIREQSGVTEHVGDVQEPNVGGVPRPGLDPNSLYDEVYHEGEILDSVYGQVQGATPPSEGDQIIPTEPFDPSEYVTLNPQPLPPEPPPYLSSAHEQTIEGIDSLIQVTQMKSENANEEAIKDGLDLSSAYEEVSPKNPIFDPTVTEQVGLTGAEEHALQEAGFASGGAQIDAVLAEIAAVLQLVSNTSASIDEQKAAVQEKIDGLKSGLSTDTVVQPALEDLTPQQWDVIGAIITTHLQPESEPAEAGPSPDLTSSAYEEATPNNPVIDSVYGQVQETKSSKANEEALQNADEQTIDGIDSLIQVTQMKSENANEEAIKDGLDLSSVYQEATPNNPVIDSVYGQTQGATPPKVEPSQYPPDLPSPSGGEELLPDGNANGIPGEYGDGPDLDANGVPDEIGINPDSLQPGYPNSPWASSLDPALFDPTEPGPTLDPSLFDPTSPGPTLDPSLFDPHLPGVTLDPALLDPTEPGPTLDPSQLDPSAPGPTLDPTQLEQGIVQPSGVSEPASVTEQGFTAPSLTEDPATAGQDDHEHDDFFEGGV
jgi:hypothetical protein